MLVKQIRRVTKITGIVLNLLCAIALIIGCYGSRLSPTHFWFTGFFTLASFYFLLGLGAFLMFWLFAKWPLMLISLSAIAICWAPLKKLVPLRAVEGFSLAKPADQLRVMSWNVEHFDILEHKSHPEKKAEMIRMITELQPDIACFQEMVASRLHPNAINYLPEFLRKMGLDQYYYSYNSKLDFDSKHHFGIIIFSKYPIINKKTVSFPPDDYNSTFQYADIVKGTDTFRVFNIHLQSLKFSPENRRYLEDPSLKDQTDFEESRSLLEKFKTGFIKRQLQSERVRMSMLQSPYPTIVCGDFNDVPNSYAYNLIGEGMKDVFAEKGSGIGRTFYSISPTLRIDNIFVDKRFEVKQFARIQKKLSDHFPIITDISLQK